MAYTPGLLKGFRTYLCDRYGYLHMHIYMHGWGPSIAAICPNMTVGTAVAGRVVI